MAYENVTIPLMGTDDQPGLMQWVRDGKLALPRFQRSFVWKEDDIRRLLCTVARNWPAGALLLSTEMPGFEPLPLHRMTAVSSDPKYWILDGQQRITSLALVYRGLYQPNPKTKASRVVSLDLAAVKAAGIVNPEHFEFRSSTAWSNGFPTIESQSDARIVNLQDFIEFEEPNYNFWTTWLSGIKDETERAEYERIKRTGLNGLFNYNFPALKIEPGTGWDEIVWIFTHINKQGRPLGPWDLVHARTWLPKGEGEGFSLVDAWKDWEYRIGLPERNKGKRYDPYYKLSTDDILRMTKLCADFIAPPEKEGALGVSVGKIIEADTESLRSGFDGQLDVLSSVIVDLRRSAGLTPVNLRTELVIPIAVVSRQLKAALANKVSREKVLRWYWARLFSQRYDFGSTNDLLADDCRQLLAWVKNEIDGIEGVSDFWTADHPRVGVFDPERAFRAPRAGNKSLAYGVLALQVANGAMDWSSGNVIAGIPQTKLQVHHIFPTAGNAVGAENESSAADAVIEGMIADEGFEEEEIGALGGELDTEADFGDESESALEVGAPVRPVITKDAVFNFAVLEQPTNARISKHPPDQIMSLEATPKVPTPTRGCIESSLVDVTSLSSWFAFQESRVRLLSAALERQLPRGG